MSANPNTTAAQYIVNALADAGLSHVCIAPGSRSTPLTLAFAQHPTIRTTSHLDERSCGFFALGVAMATGEPVAVVCTSGTAAANFFPAIVEANMAGVPLLVLTADRPHELRHSGANQTIDQVKLYGDHVLWAVDMPLPEANPPDVATRALATTAARAMAVARGQMTPRRKGVVHLNFPFRKPLQPDNLAELQAVVTFAPHVPRIQPSESVMSDALAQELAALCSAHPDGVIVQGPRGDYAACADLAARTGYPIVADATSGGKFGAYERLPVGSYELFLAPSVYADWPKPNVIIRVGGVPTSKKLNDYIAAVRPAHYILLSDGEWMDDTHTLTKVVVGDVNANLVKLARAIDTLPPTQSALASALYGTEQFARERLRGLVRERFSDATALHHIMSRLPDEAHVFVGNSNVVRHMDEFVPADSRRRFVYASRGASGIDGQVSTALGVAAAHSLPVYALMGDITFYHDMNGLLALRRAGLRAVFFVFNNDGGGIFQRLPVHRLEPHHTDYFLTPHGLTFEHVAHLYGLAHVSVRDFDALADALDRFADAHESAIVEIHTDLRADEVWRKAMSRRVIEALS